MQEERHSFRGGGAGRKRDYGEAFIGRGKKVTGTCHSKCLRQTRSLGGGVKGGGARVPCRDLGGSAAGESHPDFRILAEYRVSLSACSGL